MPLFVWLRGEGEKDRFGDGLFDEELLESGVIGDFDMKWPTLSMASSKFVVFLRFSFLFGIFSTWRFENVKGKCG